MSKKLTRYNLSNGAKIDWIAFIALIFIIAVVPLIVYLKVVPVEGVAALYWTSDTNYDFFSYYKAIFLIFTGLIAFVIFLYKLFERKGSWKKISIYIPMLLFSVLIFLSAILAEHRDVALYGFPDRYEGLFVWLAYLLAAFLSMYYVHNDRQVKILLYSLFISAGFMGLLGIFQYIGWDFLQSEMGKRVILPSELYQFAEELSFSFGTYTIYATLYNTNNVGSYMAMLFPLTFVLSYYMKERLGQVIMGALSCLMFANLIGSNSRGGMLGTIVAFMILVAFFYPILRKYWKQSVILVCSYSVIFLMLNVISDGKALGQVGSIIPIDEDVVDTERLELEDIVLGEREVTFVFNREELTFAIEGTEIKVWDKEGEAVPYTFDEVEERFILGDERFAAYRFLTEGNLLAIFTERTTLSFVVSNEGFQFVNAWGEPMTLDPVPSWGFEGREQLGSGRGYIWSRSIPMLEDALLLGHGPDTYALYFPQHDYLGKYIGLNQTIYNVVDKPHNLYLQVGINTGVLSLLVMLVMFGMYLWQSARLYWRDRLQNFTAWGGFAIFIAVIGYLVTGLFNDSLVSVAPVFWVLFGLGVACNYLYREELKSQSAR